MKDIIVFISNNKSVLIAIIIGAIAGFLYWFYFACYWGTYPLSAECWVNCCFGAILGGFFVTLLNKKTD